MPVSGMIISSRAATIGTATLSGCCMTQRVSLPPQKPFSISSLVLVWRSFLKVSASIRLPRMPRIAGRIVMDEIAASMTAAMAP